MNMGSESNVADLSHLDELPDNLTVYIASINSNKESE